MDGPACNRIRYIGKHVSPAYIEVFFGLALGAACGGGQQKSGKTSRRMPATQKWRHHSTHSLVAQDFLVASSLDSTAITVNRKSRDTVFPQNV